MAHEVVICCANRDRAIAEALRQRMENWGIACRELEDGSPLDFSKEDRLLAAVAESSIVVAVFSDPSTNLIRIKKHLLHAIRNQVAIVPFKVRSGDGPDQGNLVLRDPKPSELLGAAAVRESERLVKQVLSLLGHRARSRSGDGSQEIGPLEVEERGHDDAATQSDSREAVDSHLRRPHRTALSAREVQDLFTKHRPGGRYHVSPLIPEIKLTNARKACGLGLNEEVVVLIDCTVFGSAKSCVLLTRRSLTGRSLGGQVVTLHYEWFPKLDFGHRPARIIATSCGGSINLSGSGVDGNAFLDVLHDIARAMKADRAGDAIDRGFGGHITDFADKSGSFQ